MENKIVLVQKPVIKHELKKAGQRVTERLAELDLENQVATLESLKFLKETRSTLNKEFKEYEVDRKIIKDACLNPYSELDEIYKPEIAEKYKNADVLLKDKIAIVENKVKEEKEANVKLYFDELCKSYNIDFLIFAQVGIEINISTTEKKYKEQCNDFVQKIVDDIELIDTQEFKAEILAEFKLTLNASKAIKEMQDRKEREKQEAERIKLKELDNRILKLKAIGMTFDEMTKVYIYNDEIYIQEDEIMLSEKGEFSLKVVGFEEKIKAFKKSIEKPVEKDEPKAPIQKTIETPTKIEPKKEPLKAPIKEEKEENFTASFEVTGTMKQLKALKEYMQENNLTFKTI